MSDEPSHIQVAEGLCAISDSYAENVTDKTVLRGILHALLAIYEELEAIHDELPRVWAG